MKALPTGLVRLCNRLAAEEMKAQTWRLGQVLRDEYLRRLTEGEGAADLEIDLQRRVAQAALDQFRLSLAPQRPRRACGTNASQHPALTP